MNFAQPATPPAHHGGDPTIQRDRWGSPLVHPPDGGSPVGYTRCTTYVDALSDQTNLVAWKARMTAIGITMREDIALRVGALDVDEDKSELNRLCEDAARTAGSSRAAEIGTQLHEAAERFDKGTPPGRLGKYQKHLDAYIQATQGIAWQGIEQFRVHDELQIGGTADRVAVIDNQAYIADIKTGGLWDVGKMAMQLAVYAHSTPYNTTTNQRYQDEIPINLNQGLLIHLQEKTGTCDLYWLNLQEGWRAVGLAGQVREWRKFHTRKATRSQVITPAVL